MKKLEDILQPDSEVGPEYTVVQPSILKAIGKTGVIGRATVIKDCAYTITTRQDRLPTQVVERPDGTFRFLTERECWRLQGYSDEEFEAAESVTPKDGNFRRPLYVQAGNSIPVPIFESIFSELLREGNPYGMEAWR